MSRLPLEQDDDADAIVSMFKVSFVDDIPVTTADIAAATAKDPILTQVYKYVPERWSQKGVSDDLCEYHQRQHQLSTDQGCVLWGTQELILQLLQARLLNESHFTHPGIVIGAEFYVVATNGSEH